MNSFFDRFWGGESPLDIGRDFFPASTFSPQADFEETERDYVVSLDVPGLKKEDLKIDIRDNLLTVSGERKDFRESGKGRNYRSERVQGSFTRSFMLPNAVRADQATAQCSEGVLKIVVPKAEPAKIHSVQVQDKLAEPASPDANQTH